MWRWDQQEPFGVNAPIENPSGLGAFDLPLRLPGQYFDKETNLHYNYFRDYDPGIGRYVQSDPIGLNGGLNTYAYVYDSPLTLVDPTGEVVPLALVAAGAGVGAVAGGLTYTLAAFSPGNQFQLSSFLGSVAGGAVAGGIGVVAAPIAGSIGLGTGIVGTGLVNAAAGLLGGSVAAAIDPCQDFSLGYAISSAAFGAAGGTLGTRLGIAVGMNPATMSNFRQVGFPRTWSGVWPSMLGGNAGPNALGSIYVGGGVSVGLGTAGPFYVQ